MEQINTKLIIPAGSAGVMLLEKVAAVRSYIPMMEVWELALNGVDAPNRKLSFGGVDLIALNLIDPVHETATSSLLQLLIPFAQNLAMSSPEAFKAFTATLVQVRPVRRIRLNIAVNGKNPQELAQHYALAAGLIESFQGSFISHLHASMQSLCRINPAFEYLSEEIRDIRDPESGGNTVYQEPVVVDWSVITRELRFLAYKDGIPANIFVERQWLASEVLVKPDNL